MQARSTGGGAPRSTAGFPSTLRLKLSLRALYAPASRALFAVDVSQWRTKHPQGRKKLFKRRRRRSAAAASTRLVAMSRLPWSSLMQRRSVDRSRSQHTSKCASSQGNGVCRGSEQRVPVRHLETAWRRRVDTRAAQSGTHRKLFEVRTSKGERNEWMLTLLARRSSVQGSQGCRVKQFVAPVPSGEAIAANTSRHEEEQPRRQAAAASVAPSGAPTE